MKYYHLIFTKDNLTYEDGVWKSDLIDLYNNDFYQNWTATRSQYGTNSIGDDTWTGFSESEGQTDTGKIIDERYLDESGQIDIDYFFLRFSDTSPSTDAIATVSVYTTDDESAYFPDEYTSLTDQAHNRYLGNINSNRYAVFHFEITSPQDIDNLDFKCVVLVSIAPPPIAPLYKSTQKMLTKFPEWMELREDSYQPATPALGRPATLAGQIVNAISGEWLEHINSQLSTYSIESFIATLDETIPSKVYEVVNTPEFFGSITNADGLEFIRASDLFELFDRKDRSDVVYINSTESTLTFLTDPETVLIDSVEYETVGKPYWNIFDEFGLMVSLMRIKDESNARFRQRILDVYINVPGVSIERLQNTLRRELDLWRAFDLDVTSSSATPLSEAATPRLLDMGDMQYDEEYWDPDGMPTAKMVALVEDLAKRYPTTWGYFIWNQAFWDADDVTGESSYGVLPNRFDATPPHDINYGVGDLDDLLITKPTNNVTDDSVDITFTVRGVEKSPIDISPKVNVRVGIYGTADKSEYVAEPVSQTFVLRVEPDPAEATPEWPPGFYMYMNFTMTAINDEDYDSATPTQNAYAIQSLVDEAYGAGLLGQTVYFSTGGEMILTEENIVRAPLLSAHWMAGEWDPNTEAVINVPVSTDWIAFHSGDTETGTIDHTTVWKELELNTDPEDGFDYLTGDIYFASIDRTIGVGTWTSEFIETQVTINGLLPDLTTDSITIDPPMIMWPEELESPPNKKYNIQLIDQKDGEYGVMTTDADGNGLFLPSSYLYVNGSNAWSVDGGMEFDVGTTNSFTFSTGTGDLYPVEDFITVPFKETYTIELGDLPSLIEQSSQDFYSQTSIGDSLFLGNFTIDKADFGLTNNDEQIVTWIGISADNEQVDVWLDSNIVEPLDDIFPNSSYPSNAVSEYYDEDSVTYQLKNIVAYMRVIPGPNKYWNPNMNTGWFFTENEEYYAYNELEIESHNAEEATLNYVPQQGAPIIVRDGATPYRQVAFHDATPSLTIYNTETIKGNGRASLYLAYNDIYDVSVSNVRTGQSIACDYQSSSNVIGLEETTDIDEEYDVTYKVRNSYYLDNDNRDSDYSLYARVVFDNATPNAEIIYEASKYEIATPIALPLHPYYTVTDDSFIFISHTEYDLSYVEAQITPDVIVSGDDDYALVTFRCYDEWENPKPNVVITLETSFGTLRDVEITTDEDGYAATVLYSEETTDMTGSITYSTQAPGGDPAYELSVETTIDASALGGWKNNTSSSMSMIGDTATYRIRHMDLRTPGADPVQTVEWVRKVPLDTENPRQNLLDLILGSGASEESPAEVAIVDSDDTPIDTTRKNVVFTIDTTTIEPTLYLIRWNSPLPVTNGSGPYVSDMLIIMDQTGVSGPFSYDLALDPVSTGTNLVDSLLGWIPTYTASISWVDGSGPSAEYSSFGQLNAVAITNTLPYKIYHPTTKAYRLVAKADHELISVDDQNRVTVNGVVQNQDNEVVPYAVVQYMVGYTIQDALLRESNSVVVDDDGDLLEIYDNWPDSGVIITDINGAFTIGPFTIQDENDPGYFFVICESENALATPDVDLIALATPQWTMVGDIAMWYEYPGIERGVENLNQLPIQSHYIKGEDQATPEIIPNYYPVGWSEQATPESATPGTFSDDLPRWYALDKYYQYQMGILGDIEEATISTDYTTGIHPEYKDL